MFQRLGTLSLWVGGLIVITVTAFALIAVTRVLNVPGFGGPPPAAERSVPATPTPIEPVLEPPITTATPGAAAPAIATESAEDPDDRTPAEDAPATVGPGSAEGSP
ncbi:MAG TPA: hypothetical protein VER55_00125 [Ardenticatenaceae bacterium]|nr:hypothetical protein [Ardenticatenaceae bacterium]